MTPLEAANKIKNIQPNVSAERSFPLFSAAIEQNQCTLFYPTHLQGADTLTPVQQKECVECIELGRDLLVDIKIRALLDLVDENESAGQDLVFLRDYTEKLYATLSELQSPSMTGVFEDREVQEKYLRLAREYLYDGYVEKLLYLNRSYMVRQRSKNRVCQILKQPTK